MPEPMAEAHRRIADAEHGVEERMLRLADGLPDSERVRRGAHEISAAADRHERLADEIDER